MNKYQIFLSILVILFGIFMIIFGGMDDSPGAQLIGLVVFIIGVVGIIKSKKRISN